VPNCPASSGAPYGVDPARRDLFGVIPKPRRLVPAKRQAVRSPLVQSKPALALPLGALQQCMVDCHIGPAGPRQLIDQEMPSRRWGSGACPERSEGAAGQQRGPAEPLNHTLQPVDSYIQGFGRRTRCRFGRRWARPCTPAPRGWGRPHARGRTAGPRCLK
jgi:hypothetical protein